LFARNSISGFIRRSLDSLRSLGMTRLRVSLEFLEQRLHGRRELRALAHPVVDALAIDLDVGRFLLRIVVADLLEGRRARRLLRVGNDHAVERRMSGAAAAQTDLQHSVRTPLKIKGV